MLSINLDTQTNNIFQDLFSSSTGYAYFSSDHFKFIPKCDRCYYKCDRHYKVRRLLQSATRQRFELQRFRVTEGKITVNVRRKSRGNPLWFQLVLGSNQQGSSYRESNKQVHSYATRHTNDFHLPVCRTNLRKFSVSFQGPIYYNSIENDIKESNFLHLFKTKLKKKLYVNYQI